MGKKRETKYEEEEEEEKKLEIAKAAAQAWLSHSHTSKRTVSEFTARPSHGSVKGKASRFKVEALSNRTKTYLPSILEWENGESSLWDPYEIVEVSKKLERGLTLEERTFSVINQYTNGFKKNSLRSLFNLSSFGRFKQT